MKYFDQQNLVLHCSSFSKTLGAGFRVGWVYAGKFSDHIQHLQLMSTISVNALIQNALVEFYLIIIMKSTCVHLDFHLSVIKAVLSLFKATFT